MTAKSKHEDMRAKFKETMLRQQAAVAQPQAPVAPTVMAEPPAVTAEKVIELPTKEVAPEKTAHRAVKTAYVSERVARPSIRLTDDDLARVRDVIGHALGLSETLNTTEVLRLALHEWNFKQLTAKKIAEIRSQDGRRKIA